MITINTAPVANRIILDGNNTDISITSTHGAGYYFRALIFINGVLFDTQSWSRKNAYTAEKDLKKLFNAYFETVFPSTFTPGISAQTHLKKQVNITIQELLMENDLVIDTISLPTFFILYNNKPVTFTDTVKAAFLGMTAAKLIIPANGKISVPFYTNTHSETVVVELKDNFGTVINTVTVPTATSKKVFLYNYDLSAAAPLVNNTIYFILTITVGATVITKPFRYIEFPDYDIKEIAYLNNFGFFVYAYLDGQMSIDNSLTGETYEQANGTDKTIEINEDFTYTINTGSLLSSEKAIMREIANALDARIFYNGEWLEMINRTKKIKDYQDRLNNYSENLTFSVNRIPDVDNTWADEPGYESEAPADSSEVASYLHINSVVQNTGDEDITPEGQYCIDISLTVGEGYPDENVVFIVTKDGGLPDISDPYIVGSLIHVCSYTAGNYTIYAIAESVSSFSNEVSFTLP